MTAWSIFCGAVKAFFGWFFLTIIFIFVASITEGFKAYCPLMSFIYGCIAVFIAVLIFGMIFGVWKK